MTQQTYSALSLYGILDRMDADSVRHWLDFHKRLKYPPRFITLFSAARFNDAPAVLRQIKDALPQTTPVWRGYDGKDAWGNIPPKGQDWDDSNFYLKMHNASLISAKMAAGLWFERRVKPYLDVIRETKTIVHLLNEATPLFNAPFETEAMIRLGEEEIRAGAFAWSAGVPDWPVYQQQSILNSIAIAAKYNALVMTHEYGGFLPKEQNSLINRNHDLVKLFPNNPDVFLGEFALCKATIIQEAGIDKIILDSGIGWREMGIHEVQYMDFIRDMTTRWYIPNKVSYGIYSWPQWGLNGSFGLEDRPTMLDLLVANSEALSFTVGEADPKPAPPIVVTPKPDPKPEPAPAPAPVPPVVMPAPQPPTSPVKVKMAYSLEIETTPQLHSLIEKFMGEILTNAIYLGQALGNSEITLVTTKVVST